MLVGWGSRVSCASDAAHDPGGLGDLRACLERY